MGYQAGRSLNRTVTSYAVYLPKITQMLTSGANDQCDIIWNNDDWGQDLAQYLEPLDDVPDARNVEVGQLEPFHNADGKTTAVSMTTTAGILFYRTDLIPRRSCRRPGTISSRPVRSCSPKRRSNGVTSAA